jgi:hypothetical protein
MHSTPVTASTDVAGRDVRSLMIVLLPVQRRQKPGTLGRMEPVVGNESVDIDRATAWVRSVVGASGPLRLAETEPWASVYRAETPDGPIWFKACAPTHAFEVPLTASLSARWPDVATDVLAHDVDRRWLLMADAGEPLSVLGDPPERWEVLLPAYAELQLGETAHIAEHLASGTPDLRLGVLPALFEDLLLADLPLAPSEHAELARFAPRFDELCRELEGAGIEPSVQHDDLHRHNVYVKGERLRLLDWGDASIGHPYFSLFEVFRFMHEVHHPPGDDPWFMRLRDAYLEPWEGDQRAVFALAHAVGGLAHGIAWLRQRQALPELERAAFDVGFSAVLRIAITEMRSLGL